MRASSIGAMVVAITVAGAVQAAELAYLRVPAGEPLPVYAALPPVGAGEPTLAPGRVVTIDAARLGSGFAYVVALPLLDGPPIPLEGFVDVDRLERVHPRTHPNGLPVGGECRATQPYWHVDWSHGALFAIDTPFDRSMIMVVPPATAAPLFYASRGLTQSAIVQLAPSELCVFPDGRAGIAASLLATIEGQSSVRAGCCTASMAAF